MDELKAALSKRPLRRGAGKRVGPGSEIERILTLARHKQEDGDVAAAERTLSDLAALLEDNPQYDMEHKLVEDSLEDLRKRRTEQAPDPSFVESALDRADRLLADGKREEAARIWQGIADLYEHDPQAAALVERARRNLAATPANPVPMKGTPVKPASGQVSP